MELITSGTLNVTTGGGFTSTVNATAFYVVEVNVSNMTNGDDIYINDEASLYEVVLKGAQTNVVYATPPYPMFPTNAIGMFRTSGSDFDVDYKIYKAVDPIVSSTSTHNLTSGNASVTFSISTPGVYVPYMYLSGLTGTIDKATVKAKVDGVVIWEDDTDSSGFSTKVTPPFVVNTSGAVHVNMTATSPFDADVVYSLYKVS